MLTNYWIDDSYSPKIENLILLIFNWIAYIAGLKEVIFFYESTEDIDF